MVFAGFLWSFRGWVLGFVSIVYFVVRIRWRSGFIVNFFRGFLSSGIFRSFLRMFGYIFGYIF